MPSLQNAAPGAKSSKMQGLNPFTPFLAQPGDLDADNEGPQDDQFLSESMDRRLRVSESTSLATFQATHPQPMQQPATGPTLTANSQVSGPMTNTSASAEALFNKSDEKKIPEPAGGPNNIDDSDSDLDEFDDDDEALEAFRQRRLAELKREHGERVQQQAKGHGEVRTISQDEFLPECTGGSKFVVVHFFHDDFERCKIMDHHLKVIAPLHLGCKFVRINAEKAPFFVAKLAIKTLPTLLVFKDGKTVDRLVGFDGLSDSGNPDKFPTSRLGEWLEKTGAIEYEGPESDDDDDDEGENRRATGKLPSRIQIYDEDL